MKDEAPGVIAGETLEQVGDAESVTVQKPARSEVSTGRSAFFVGVGILISRVVGLIRQRIFAHYFGSLGEGDAFSAAFRIPNFLQNVLAKERSPLRSFRSTQNYSQEDEKEAARVANAIFSILALVTAVIVLIGVRHSLRHANRRGF